MFVDARSRDGSTALILAVKNRRTDIAAVLLEKGAAVNKQDTEGASAMKAVRCCE